MQKVKVFYNFIFQTIESYLNVCIFMKICVCPDQTKDTDWNDLQQGLI